ncbi:UdgX family uracil-DNA binding protein [Rubellimicrobium sp. CFH 75288]|uniref:UdgX family uracil-DNA binding protein n=1 Tax=Rubellimicrobium sp. CFH 75288 TaxID=2697034 RepID=UPI0014126220|nr:UdgX family uracil-DNA binding protein [Rubellimicrobium sp. CFH 75288]NAZ36287.1 UdgX family uracil-DNA binding protein [Rubellimicrobium sp. CFH 75288]
MPHIALPPTGTAAAWREAARACLSARLPPEAVTWSRGAEAGVLFDEGEAPPPVKAGPIRVPAAFVEMAAQVCWHRDPQRFARLYAFLWRLRLKPALMEDAADPALVALRGMEKAVRRDIHKTHAFVRFREVGERDAPRRRFAAWFEPQHLTLEPSAPFFARRFGDMDWLIATPDLTARFEGGVLRLEEGAPRPELTADDAEELWRTYFRNIFNPARANPARMLAEMPRRYWANLPEAQTIPDLLREAEGRVRAMAEAAPKEAPFYARALAARREEAAAPAPAPAGGLAGLVREIEGCRRCPLWEGATRAVAGEGPVDAALALVGEQPGDGEDLGGRPFVGPAGQLLDGVLREAGIARERTYLTNAVKHFKYTLKGRRRIHQSPSGGEIAACRPWLLAELAELRPKLVVALGATAAAALTGRGEGILKRRGRIEEGPDGLPVLLTVHPSFLLRLPDPVLRETETERFREDLVAARTWLEAQQAA